MDHAGDAMCSAGDVSAIRPGHDARGVGYEPSVMLAFREFGDYAKRS